MRSGPRSCSPAVRHSKAPRCRFAQQGGTRTPHSIAPPRGGYVADVCGQPICQDHSWTEGSIFLRDKAVAPPHFTPARNAGRECGER